MKESAAARAIREANELALRPPPRGVGTLTVDTNAGRAVREGGKGSAPNAANPLLAVTCGRPLPPLLPGTVGGLLPALPVGSAGWDSAKASTPAEGLVVAQIAAALLLPPATRTTPGRTPMRTLGRGLPLGAGPMVDDHATVCYATCAGRPDPAASWAPRLVDITYPGIEGTLKAWADPAVATAWFDYAHALASDVAWETTLDDVTPTNVGRTDENRRRYLWQRDYMESIVGAIANGFNALNVPWSAHQASRDLYRKWLAGVGVTESKTTDYNEGNWYAKTDDRADFAELFAVLKRGDENPNAGIIPRELRKQFNTYGLPDGATWNLEFEPSVGLHLVPLSGERDAAGAWIKPWYEPETVNQAYVTSRTHEWIRHESTRLDNLDGPSMTEVEWSARGQARWPWSRRLRDWRTFSFDYNYLKNNLDVRRTAGTGGRVVVSAPLKAYLPWLREWAAKLVELGGAQVLRESRRDVIRTNWAAIRAEGGVRGFLGVAATADTTALTEGTANPNLPLTMVSALATGAGLALAPVTAGISAVVGGAIGAVTGVLATLLRSGSVTSTALDDLGRWKPVFERAHLGGDVDDPAKPPRQNVPVPPGFCRAVLGDDGLPDHVEVTVVPPDDGGGSGGGGDDEAATGLSTTTLVVGGLATAGVAVGIGVLIARARTKR